MNVVATYGRSLYALVISLFCTRWVLLALGEVNFGLFGVVGGLIAICAVFNALLSSATTRFFSVAMGEAANLDPVKGLEYCRRWFNVSVLAHTVLACFLIVLGYPIGAWAIESCLTIPPEKIGDCLWVFRFSCLATFVSMVNVPFTGMFVAKQEIAEQSLYGIVQTTLGFCIAAYMIMHPGYWLVGYAALLCTNAMLFEVAICLRACQKYRECRLSLVFMRDSSRLGQMFRFAFYQSFTGIGFVCLNQGMNIFVNKVFGPTLNASMGVATKVQTQASALTTALGTAFQPAIATAWGAGDLERVRCLALRATKFGLFGALVFVVPLLVGIDWVLILWLKTPPPHASLLCTCLLIAFAVDKFGLGQDMAINASGRIGWYQFCQGVSWMSSLPLAICFYRCGGGVSSVGFGLVMGFSLASLVRIIFAHVLLGFPLVEFLLHQVVRVVVVAVVPVVLGLAIVRHVMGTGVVAVLMAFASLLFVGAFWGWVLVDEERSIVLKWVKGFLGRKFRVN